jgi:hypothetical protein
MFPGDLTIGLSRNPKFLSGIIGLETAGYFHELNLYGDTPVKLLTDTDVEFNCDYIVYVPKIFHSDDDLLHLGGDLYVTLPERTVCELIVSNRNEEMLYETLDNYLFKHSKSRLLKCARKYKCLEAVQRRINSMQGYMDDMLNY